MHVPVVLLFIDDHQQHLRHGVVDTFDVAVAVGVEGAGSTLRVSRRKYTRLLSLAVNCLPLTERRVVGTRHVEM